MASYLGEYRGAARNRDKKIIRAINSVLDQTYKDIELIIVSDGCNKTVEIVKNSYLYNDKVFGYQIPKQVKWSGVPRNTGIQKATGEWILYLDVDDYLLSTHVEKIMSKVKTDDSWVWFDDMIATHEGKVKKRACILSLGKCGTSNIAHRKIALWDEKGTYAHDWRFIKNLYAVHRKPRKILAGEYVVCHIPGRIDA